MRKIYLQTTLAQDTSVPVESTLVIRHENDTKIVFKKKHEYTVGALSGRFTAEQCALIEKIDYMLKENNQPEMTVEEMKWAVSPQFSTARKI